MSEEEKRERARQTSRMWRAQNLERARENYRQYRLANLEAVREKDRRCKVAWRAAHPGEGAAKNAEWAAKNPDKLKAIQLRASRKHAATHREQLRAKDAQRRRDHPDICRQKTRKWRASNLEHARELTRQSLRKWRESHREADSANRASRRAIKVIAGGSHTAQDILDLYRTQGGICAACSSPFPATGMHRYSVDHIRPLKPRDGGPPGSNGPENLQLLCRRCNCSKKNLGPSEWAVRLQFLKS